MTPAARLAAAAEVLDLIQRGRAPAEAVLKTWGQTHRFAGSKDRRAVADRVYRCLRARARLAWAMEAETGRALVLGSLSLIDGLALDEIAALYSGEGYGPVPLSSDELARLEAPEGRPPGWVSAGLPAFVLDDLKARLGDDWAGEAEALLAARAPIDLRVNGASTTVEAMEAELRQAGLSPERTPLSAWGLRLVAEPPPNLQALEAFKAGGFEIQDEASQVVSWLAGARPGMTVVDYCAGGGGKTLALGQAMAGEGRLVACDVVQKRLDNIRPRLTRAGLQADLRLLGEVGEGVEDLENQADLVFVDAPCSGSGTWRRRPEDAWRLTESEVERLHRLQVAILDRAARLVKPDGRLVYVTCSVLTAENEATLDAFEGTEVRFARLPLEEAAGLAPDAIDRLSGPRLRLSPGSTHTDGFFFAAYQRTA